MVLVAFVYKMVFAIIVLLIFSTITFSMSLYFQDQPTISDWLRTEPHWFAYALFVAVVFFLWLGLHLAFPGRI